MSGAVAVEPRQSSFSPALSDVSPQWRHIRRRADDGICRRPVVNAKLLRESGEAYESIGVDGNHGVLAIGTSCPDSGACVPSP